MEQRGEDAILSLLAHEHAHLYLHHLAIDHFVMDAWDELGRSLTPARRQALEDFLHDGWTAGGAFAAGFAGQPLGISLLRDDFRDMRMTSLS